MDIDLQKMKDLKEIFDKPDHDTFGNLLRGAGSNWPLIMFFAGIAFWVITNVSATKSIDLIQDGKIDGNAKAIEILTANLNSLTTELRGSVKANDSANSEITRRLDLIQKDIEIIKTQK